MFAILGIVAGISAGPIMSLPSKVLSAESRAVGMGIFFTVFYVISPVTPLAAGILARAAGTARATFDLGAAMLVACCAALWLFSRLARGGPSD